MYDIGFGTNVNRGKNKRFIMEETFLGLNYAKIFTYMGGYRADNVKMNKHSLHLQKETPQACSIAKLSALPH